ncbi:hypothetical protein B0H16DRAFT_1744416 [Mycena metata]|uniref:Uncharacterized protein n=1 Tax=Mycena metata TaxID=1033252 RepID=A0AAD7ME44_9AGAR|nr:hypothetical protein B0H16DRAFT_1744416 [Mycena metata]
MPATPAASTHRAAQGTSEFVRAMEAGDGNLRSTMQRGGSCALRRGGSCALRSRRVCWCGSVSLDADEARDGGEGDGALRGGASRGRAQRRRQAVLIILPSSCVFARTSAHPPGHTNPWTSAFGQHPSRPPPTPPTPLASSATSNGGPHQMDESLRQPRVRVPVGRGGEVRGGGRDEGGVAREEGARGGGGGDVLVTNVGGRKDVEGVVVEGAPPPKGYMQEDADEECAGGTMGCSNVGCAAGGAGKTNGVWPCVKDAVSVGAGDSAETPRHVAAYVTA